jgi:hypothetical protein
LFTSDELTVQSPPDVLPRLQNSQTPLKSALSRDTLSPYINRKGAAMITRETTVVHTTDRFMKVIFVIIAVCMVWNVLVDSAPPVEAQVPSRMEINCSYGCP